LEEGAVALELWGVMAEPVAAMSEPLALISSLAVLEEEQAEEMSEHEGVPQQKLRRHQ
jgi:hypothetical protein